MYGLVEYLNELYKKCEIPFELCIDNKVAFKTNPFLYTDKEIIEARFNINNKICILRTYSNFKDSLKLIKFCIENRCKDEYDVRENTIISLLKNEYVSSDKLNDIMFELNEVYLISINLEEKISETIDILKTIYIDTEVSILEYNEYIILLGTFEDIEDHISSITETIHNNLYKRCYISYYEVKDYNNISSLYKEGIYKINLAKKYNISNRIFNEKNLLFESIVDSLSEEKKVKILSKFNDGFNKLDDDTINTIEVFFNCDLNLSESAKNLYVHRNTLIYRLDKIKKCTSYDIRNFNEAILFKIAFFVWKESKV
ncbi:MULTISPECIES: helix-turn-helix domain-containing protein [unclassified Clostridium]|uniref:PucR family transcriptional regulator n=1 Tax=unclassified Clostridium TaxID=2614128 RepID=UPI0013F8B29C|nr:MULTISPECIES: helix-turn-helix domain-containing protein [unclassified Clostridium]NFR86482.1 PucR family transcriptional regulator [Clostridium botulinum]NFR89278.1 PucR family transcriptional regulator [Clostridium botulinum]NFT97683.1 PucR family transcriptional regulator [Clostridium botulinum]